MADSGCIGTNSLIPAHTPHTPLIPAKAGIQRVRPLGPRFRGDERNCKGCAGTRRWATLRPTHFAHSRGARVEPGPSAMSFFVYILASKRNGTLYVGMTDELVRRVWQHRTGALPGFTRRYGVKTLVWYETHET